MSGLCSNSVVGGLTCTDGPLHPGGLDLGCASFVHRGMVATSLQRIHTVGERSLVSCKISSALCDFLRKFFLALSWMRKCLLREKRKAKEIGELHDADAMERQGSNEYNKKNTETVLEIGSLLP